MSAVTKLRLGLLGALLLVAVGGAPAGAREASVGTDVEAWYATLPQLAPRAEGTLHVGVTAGLEDSRSYLTLDLTSIPRGSEIVDGTLTLPVDLQSSQSPETATMQACVAGSPGASVEGSTDPPPAVECTDAVDAEWAEGAFTVDLAPFAGRLRTVGIALVPLPESLATWHVALWSRESTAADAVPITATLTLPDLAPAAAPVADESDEPVEAALPVFAAPGTEIASGVDPVPLPPVFDAVEESRPALGAGPLPVGDDARYADSLVFTLPLVLVALAWGMGYALTRPVALAERRDVSRREGLLVPRRAPLRARDARAPRASG